MKKKNSPRGELFVVGIYSKIYVNKSIENPRECNPTNLGTT